MKSCAGVGVLLVCLFVAPATAAAPVVLKDKTQLLELLKSNPSITVIDGRPSRARMQKPIPFSLVPDEMNVEFTGTAVIIADSESKAIALAQKLSKNGKRRLYVVRGGYEAWIQAQSPNQRGDTEGAAVSEEFIIPHNTCEQGDALQVYQE